MFLRTLKGFKYSSPLIFRRFSTASAFPVKNLVDSLLYMPTSMSKVELHAKSIPILQKIKPNLHELTKDDILNLEIFTVNHDLIDKDLSDFFTRNFKNMLLSRSISLKEFSTHLSLLQGERTPEELKLITDYINLFKTDLTPNSVCQLLFSCQGITFPDRSIGHLLEEKAVEFLPYMNPHQILTVATGMASRFNNSSDFWQRVETRILARFFSLHPKQINDFCIIFLESGKGSENFWKTCNEALEASVEDYENLKFFFPYMGKGKKGSPEFWSKYEKKILERLPKMDDLELLDHFKVLTESEKGSMETCYAINDELKVRIKNYDLYMHYLYAVTLMPFNRMKISHDLWSEIAHKLVNEYHNLDEASKCRLSAEIEPFQKEGKEKEDEHEINDEYEGLQGEEMKEEITHSTKTVDQKEKKDYKKPATFEKKTTNIDKKTANQDKKQPGADQEKTTSSPEKLDKKEKAEKGEHQKGDKTDQGKASQDKKHEAPKEKQHQDKKKEFTKKGSGGKGKFEKKENKGVAEKQQQKKKVQKWRNKLL